MSSTKTGTYLSSESKLRDCWSWTGLVSENGNDQLTVPRRPSDEASTKLEQDFTTEIAALSKPKLEPSPSEVSVKSQAMEIKNLKKDSPTQIAPKRPTSESEPSPPPLSAAKPEQTAALITHSIIGPSHKAGLTTGEAKVRFDFGRLRGSDRDIDAEPTEGAATTEEKVRRSRARHWGYGFVLLIMFTIFGSITISTYLVFLKANISIPNIIVYSSIVALLFFLIILIGRYLALIYLSFLHHTRSRSLRDIKPNPRMKASILVPAYNEQEDIEASILSLVDLDYPNFEVIVINDGSKDKTLEIAKKLEGWHRGVRVRVLNQKNMGKAMALNNGAKAATGDIIVCVDGDSRLARHSLRMGMRHFENPGTHAIAGNVKVVNRVNILTKLQTLEYIEGLNLVRRAQAYIKAVNIIPGPIGMFRKDALLSVGGWENDTFAEDCDLTLKLLTHGYRIDYEPEAISYTEAPEIINMLLKQRYRWTRGILQSVRKHSIYLINPRVGWRVWITLWQMVFESLIWPFMNILANVLFLIVAFLFGMSPLIVLWWIQLTILDTIAAMHTVAVEREKLYLIPYAIIYRLVFIQVVDVTKLLATIEEMVGLRMGWGKIERRGRL